MIVRYYVAHAATTVDSPAGPVTLKAGDSLRWAVIDAVPPRILDGGPLSEPMTEDEYVAWQQTKRLIEHAEFVEAVREQAFHSDDPGTAARFPGGIVHSFVGSLGADWSAESVIDALSRAFLVEWDTQHLFGHQLHVRWNDEASPALPPRHRAAHFDVKQPVVEDIEGAPLPPSCQAGGDVFYAVRAWMRSVLSDDVDFDIELRNLLIALAPHIKAEDAVDWEAVCQRAMAVCAGAGAPGDATLPEACEWLAYQIHGPSLQPGVPSPLERALEAIRLTQEYAQLPAVEGWTWYDVYRSLRPDDAERLRQDWLRHDAARRMRVARDANDHERARGDRRRRWGFGRR